MTTYEAEADARKGEELEHFHPETEEPPQKVSGQLTPKLA
jgi:hypothetical protein